MGFVGGIVGEPSIITVFMMWQKLIVGLCAKSNPDVTLTVCFCGTYAVEIYIEAQMTQRSSTSPQTLLLFYFFCFSQARGILSAV